MNKTSNTSNYYNRMHNFGICVTILATIVIFSVPFIICMIFDIMPSLQEMFLTGGPILAIFIPLSLAETIAETPIMGTSYYLAGVTGNILNLKLPATFNALKISNVSKGTEEADAIIGVAVAASSAVTLIFLALGVVLLTPLKPMLESDVVTTATKYVLPALFGCMSIMTFSRNIGGGVKIYGRGLALILPVVICAVLFLFVMPEKYGLYQGVIALVLIPLIYVSNKILYKKGKITVEMPEQH